MSEWQIWCAGLPAALAPALACWLVSTVRRDVSLVDRVWSLLLVATALCYAELTPRSSPRSYLLAVLLAIWALRLALYITVRNWGHGEDRRYQAIRRRHEPGFAWKSLYLVFALQAALAWVVSLPLLGALGAGAASLGWLDALGVCVWGGGFLLETLADWQLARFRARPDSRGQVQASGLWRYSRHPNYFGECCVWWGFYLLALAAGAWWTLPGPVLMTVLLRRVSGVTLLEQDIGERRPGYRQYIERTSPFVPWPPKGGGVVP